MNTKIDKIVEDISEIKVILGQQHVELKTHIKRTELAEENIKLFRKEMTDELKPVKKHVALIDASLKILGLIPVLIGVVVGIIEIIKLVQ